MNVHDIIPIIDPNPIPGPFWLFKLLLMVTFLLHILAMNMMMGVAVIALAAKFKIQNEMYQKLYDNLKSKIPNLLPATITLGVAPLLFAQVLYGPYLYTATIISGWVWFSIIILLTVAYYGFYFVSFKKEEKFKKPILILSVALIMFIALIYTTNVLLYMQPQYWAEKYFEQPAGAHLFLDDATLIPRFLHFIIGALAIGGLFVAVIGYLKRKKEPEFAAFLIKHGGRWFMFATMAQFVVGSWFLVALPREQMLLFMGKNMAASILLVLSMGLTLLTIFMMSRKLKGEVLQAPVAAISFITFIVLVMMIVMRDILRDSYLGPYFRVEELSFQPQWGVLTLFLLLFAAGILVWLWMLKKYPFQADVKNEKGV
ncbi:hypothetical protein [Caldithrix abyssi]